MCFNSGRLPPRGQRKHREQKGEQRKHREQKGERAGARAHVDAAPAATPCARLAGGVASQAAKAKLAVSPAAGAPGARKRKPSAASGADAASGAMAAMATPAMEMLERADATGMFPEGVSWATKVEMLQLAKQDAWQRGGTRLSRFMARWQKRVGLQS